MMQPQGYSPFDTPALRATLAFGEWVANFFAQTVEVFLRFGFGERYFSLFGIWGIFGHYTAIYILATFLKLVSNNNYIELFLILSLVATFGHKLVIQIRNWKGERWHSRYPGTPLLLLLLSPLAKVVSDLFPYLKFITPNNLTFFIRRILEPLLICTLGIVINEVIYYDSRPLPLWLLLSGISLGIKESIAATRLRNIMLDAIDAEIEKKNLWAVLKEQKTPDETEGFVFPVPRGFNDEKRESLYRGLLNRLTGSAERPASSGNNARSTLEAGREQNQEQKIPDFG
jgi:hypothetical protein